LGNVKYHRKGMLKQFNLSPKFCDDGRKKEVVLKGEEKGVVELTMYGRVFDFPTHPEKTHYGNLKVSHNV